LAIGSAKTKAIVGGLTLPKPKATIKQRLWAIFGQGYDKTSDEAIKVAPKYTTRKEYWRACQDAGMPGYVRRPVVEAEPDTTAPPQQPQGSEANADTKPASSGSTTRFHIGQAKEADEVADYV